MTSQSASHARGTLDAAFQKVPYLRDRCISMASAKEKGAGLSGVKLLRLVGKHFNDVFIQAVSGFCLKVPSQDHPKCRADCGHLLRNVQLLSLVVEVQNENEGMNPSLNHAKTITILHENQLRLGQNFSARRPGDVYVSLAAPVVHSVDYL